MDEKGFHSRLEGVAVPEVEAPAYRQRLKQALLAAHAARRQARPAWRLPGLSWRAWRPALVALATVAALALVVALPLLQLPPAPALSASQIALNDPEVQASFSSTELASLSVQELENEGGQTLVLLSANSGAMVMVGVDMAAKKVSQWLLSALGAAESEYQLVFNSEMSGLAGIYVMNPDGSRLTRLTDSQTRYDSSVWSPAREKFAVVKWDADSRLLCLMDYDGRNVTPLTYGDPPHRLYGAHDPVWSPDGETLAFTAGSGNGTDIFTLSGPNLEKFTCLTTADFTTWDSMVGWSPDGSKIVFFSNRDGNWKLYLMNADGTGQRPLLPGPSKDNTIISWSPDGQRLAFSSQSNSGDNNTSEIYTVDADGAGLVRLTNNAAWDNCPAWSPDGTKIAFRSNRDGCQEIYLMNPDGSAQTRLTYNNTYASWPQWSPDGTQITFRSKESAEAALSDLYIMNADGTNQRRLAGGWLNSPPLWVKLPAYPTPTMPQDVTIAPPPITATPQTAVTVGLPRLYAPSGTQVAVPEDAWPVKKEEAIARALAYLPPALASQAEVTPSFGWGAPGWGLGEPLWTIGIKGISIPPAELGWEARHATTVVNGTALELLPFTILDGPGPYRWLIITLSGLDGSLKWRFAITKPPV